MSQPRNQYNLKLFSRQLILCVKDVLLFSKFLESIVEEGKKKKKTSCGSATESHLILFTVMNTKNLIKME